MNQETFSPCSTACWPRASSRNVLPVPEGPQRTRFSLRVTHSRVRSACWVGTGIEEAASSQASKVLPVGKPAAVRRVASAARSRPAASSLSRARRTSTGSQRWALAVAMTSGAWVRMCAAVAGAAAFGGPPAAAGPPGPESRHCRGRRAHEATSSPVAASSPCWWPSAAQALVPWVSERSSPARGVAPGRALAWWWALTLVRGHAESRNRGRERES